MILSVRTGRPGSRPSPQAPGKLPRPAHIPSEKRPMAEPRCRQPLPAFAPRPPPSAQTAAPRLTHSLTFLVSFTSFLPFPIAAPSYTSRQPTGTSPTSSAS